jgi:hypothetical protein
VREQGGQRGIGVLGQALLGLGRQHDALDGERGAVHALGPGDRAEQALQVVARGQALLLDRGQVLGVGRRHGEHLGRQLAGEGGLGVQRGLRADQREHPHGTVPAAGRDVPLDLGDGLGERALRGADGRLVGGGVRGAAHGGHPRISIRPGDERRGTAGVWEPGCHLARCAQRAPGVPGACTRDPPTARTSRP